MRLTVRYGIVGSVDVFMCCSVTRSPVFSSDVCYDDSHALRNSASIRCGSLRNAEGVVVPY